MHPRLPGTPLPLESLGERTELAGALGRAIARIHELPPSLVESTDAPVYSAEELRQRHLVEIDRASATGSVPVPLLARWEKALEEVGAWKFAPCCVHGDLAAENVLVTDDEISAVLDWGELRVSDPADDLGWIVLGASPEVLTTVLEAYTEARREPPDTHLARRARFCGELAMARWLVHGVSVDDHEIVDDAVAMLTDLEAAVADTPW